MLRIETESKGGCGTTLRFTDEYEAKIQNAERQRRFGLLKKLGAMVAKIHDEDGFPEGSYPLRPALETASYKDWSADLEKHKFSKPIIEKLMRSIENQRGFTIDRLTILYTLIELEKGRRILIADFVEGQGDVNSPSRGGSIAKRMGVINARIVAPPPGTLKSKYKSIKKQSERLIVLQFGGVRLCVKKSSHKTASGKQMADIIAKMPPPNLSSITKNWDAFL